jgi:hypothetical protein
MTTDFAKLYTYCTFLGCFIYDYIGRTVQKIGTFEIDLSYNFIVRKKKANNFLKYTSYIFYSATDSSSHLNRIHLKY